MRASQIAGIQRAIFTGHEISYAEQAQEIFLIRLDLELPRALKLGGVFQHAAVLSREERIESLARPQTVVVPHAEIGWASGVHQDAGILVSADLGRDTVFYCRKRIGRKI